MIPKCTWGETLEKSFMWSSCLLINAKKSQCLLISKSIGAINLNPVILGGEILPYIDDVNNLGVIISSKLEWHLNVQAICRKIITGLRFLYQFGKNIPQSIKLRVAQAIFIPHLLTSDVVMGELSAPDFGSLQKVCNSITRFIYGLRKFDHISHVSNSLLGMPLKNFTMYHRCLFLFKLIFLGTPEYLREKITLVISARFPLNVVIPRHLGLSASRRFFVHDVTFWNTIPNNVKNQSSVLTYKTKSLEFFKSIDLNR